MPAKGGGRKKTIGEYGPPTLTPTQVLVDDDENCEETWRNKKQVEEVEDSETKDDTMKNSKKRKTSKGEEEEEA